MSFRITGPRSPTRQRLHATKGLAKTSAAWTHMATKSTTLVLVALLVSASCTTEDDGEDNAASEIAWLVNLDAVNDDVALPKGTETFNVGIFGTDTDGVRRVTLSYSGGYSCGSADSPIGSSAQVSIEPIVNEATKNDAGEVPTVLDATHDVPRGDCGDQPLFCGGSYQMRAAVEPLTGPTFEETLNVTIPGDDAC